MTGPDPSPSSAASPSASPSASSSPSSPAPPPPRTSPSALDVLDWRRRVAALYRDVRVAPDPAAGHAAWTAGRDELYRDHPASPLLPGDPRHAGLPVAPYDPAFRFEVALEAPADPPGRLEVPTGTDGLAAFDQAGVVRLPGLGSLDVWWLASYGGGVFLPVRDATSGTGSFGGGRYVLDTVKGADLGGAGGSLVVDLNFAYNPSCAYDEGWACPLAPAGNRLEAEVPVGELMPA